MTSTNLQFVICINPVEYKCEVQTLLLAYAENNKSIE